MSAEQQAELNGDALWTEHFNSLCDLLLYFISRSIELLDDGGELVFITPDFWLGTAHSSSLRQMLHERGVVTDIIRFGEARVFRGVASSIIIFRFVKGSPADEDTQILIHRYIGPARNPAFDEKSPFAAHLDLNEISSFDHHFVQHPHTSNPWTLEADDARLAADRLEAACEGCTLGQISRIANGMVSGLDRAFRLPDDLQLSAAEHTATIRVLKGKDLKPNAHGSTHDYVFAEDIESEDELRDQLPALYSHLLPRKDDLLARYDYGKGRQWWHWSFLRNLSFFDSTPKIMIPCKERITNKDRLRAAVVEPGIYATQDVSSIRLNEYVREHPRYVAALISSRAWFEWNRHRGLIKGGVAEFSEAPLSRVPVRRIDWDNPTDVIIHDRIVAASRARRQADEIDQLIEQLLVLR